MSKQRPVGAYESTQCPASSLCGEIKKKLWLQSATNSAPTILSSWPQGVHKPVCHEVCLYIDTVHGMIWYQWKQKKRTIKQTSLCNSLWKIYKSKNNLDFWKCTYNSERFVEKSFWSKIAFPELQCTVCRTAWTPEASQSLVGGPMAS